MAFFCVLRVFGHEHQFDFLLELRQALLAGGHFLAGHVFELRVALVEQQGFALIEVAEQGGIFPPRGHEVFQFLVFLGQADVAWLVGDDGGVGNERRHFLKARLQRV